MALDTIIPRNAPGIAGFASESIGNMDEVRFGDTPATTTTEAVGASTTLELYQVVALVAGLLVPAQYTDVYGVATGELTFAGVGIADETITIGNKVYTLKAAPTTVANEVKIGASAAATAANLIAAINLTGTPGTDYGSLTTKHTQVSAAQGSTTAKVKVTALAAGDEGNAIATTETGTNLSWAAATLTLGDDDVSLRPYGITTAPVVTGVSQTTTIDVYRSGHWSMDALVWHASFDTDEKKKRAFEGSLSPTNFVSKKKWNNDVFENTPG